MPPPDFRAGHSHLRDEWVHEHGLPDLPSTPVALGESLPTACWVGPRTAAVLHVHRSQDDGVPEPHTGTDLKLQWTPDDDGRKALYGEVGADAAVAEVEQFGEVIRRAIEAPTGRVVVCVVADAPCRVRFFDREGALLAEIEEPAGVEGVPRRA